MSDKDENIYGLIAGIIREETKYLRHYIGKVVINVDSEMKGRIKCTVDELGWDNPAIAVSCYPRQMHALTVPQVGEYVEIYFMGGDPAKAVYMGIASEMANMKPSKYTSQFIHVLWQHPKDSSGMVYDENQKQLKANFNNIIFNDGTEPFVLGEAAKTEWTKIKQALTDLQTAFNSWTPVAPPGNSEAALKALLATFLADVMPDFSNVLSTTIKAK